MSDQQGNSGRNASSDELRSKIAITRARFADDIEAARLKLSRDGLRREAISAIRGVGQESSTAVSSLGSSAQHGASHMGSTVVDFVRRYPVATTLVGLGLAWLATQGARGGGHQHGIEATRPSRELPESWRSLEAEPHGWK